MSKTMMMWLALSVVSAALYALPAVASATPAHISATDNFTVTNIGEALVEDVKGNKVACHGGVAGSGSFENTTTGTFNLVFQGCTSSGVSCNSAGQPSGTIATTALPFHLIMLAASAPGILVTSNAGHFATFTCTIFVKKEVKGNGVLGTITAPECGQASTTATLSFAQGASTGLPQHTTYTGVEYHRFVNGTKATQEATSQIHFSTAKSLTCT